MSWAKVLRLSYSKPRTRIHSRPQDFWLKKICANANICRKAQDFGCINLLIHPTKNHLVFIIYRIDTFFHNVQLVRQAIFSSEFFQKHHSTSHFFPPKKMSHQNVFGDFKGQNFQQLLGRRTGSSDLTLPSFIVTWTGRPHGGSRWILGTQHAGKHGSTKVFSKIFSNEIKQVLGGWNTWTQKMSFFI